MTRTPEQILYLYRQRKARLVPLHQRMATIFNIYNGNTTVSIPDMEREEHAAIPNILSQGVDQMAGRITSTMPLPSFASEKPGTRKFDRRALDAGRVVGAWWEMDNLPLKDKTRARRFVAYGMAPTVMQWNFTEHRPVWRVRHPMETYLPPDLEPGQVAPADCIFGYTRSLGWLRQNGFEQECRVLLAEYARNHDVTNDLLIDLVEYIDGDWTVLIAAGSFGQDSAGYYDSASSYRGVLLCAYPNLTGGLCPVVVPTRLTLDDMTGQFDGMIGMYYQQSKLTVLENIAVEKGIFPDTYLEARAGETPQIVEGPYDGRSGLITVVKGGVIKTEQTQPGYLTNPTIDRIERATRLTSGMPAEFGGESPTNIRTGRRGDAVMSAVIDFPVGEAQGVFQYARKREDEIAIEMAKAIDGGTKRTLYVGAGNNRRPVTYSADETFAIAEHVVSYPVVGADLNQLLLGTGQRLGQGTISKRTAMELDPWVDNPEMEHDAIIFEGIEQAMVAGIQQQAASGQIPPAVLSKIMKLVKTDKMELAEAITQVTQEALEQQQAQQGAVPGAPPGPPGTVDEAMAPAALSAMVAGQPAVPPVPPAQFNLSNVLNTLRHTSRSVA